MRRDLDLASWSEVRRQRRADARARVGTSRSSRDRPDPVFVVELRRSWQRDEPDNLRSSKRSPDTDWTENDVLDINSYRDLVAVVSFLPVMNKRFHLARLGPSTRLGGRSLRSFAKLGPARSVVKS